MTNTPHDPSKDGKLHQATDTVPVPLFTWHGMDVYPLHGAEGDDGDDGDSGSAPDDDEPAGGAGEGKPETDAEKVSREDFDKLRTQLSANDKARAALEKKLKEIEDGKKDELTKATERADTLEKTVAKQASELAEARLQNAFLTADTGVTWHDPADALALAERQGYLAEVVGEDGKVDGSKLAAKLKELAKAKPHLVKSDGSKQDDVKPPNTGGKVGSKGSAGGSKEDSIPDRYSKFLNR